MSFWRKRYPNRVYDIYYKGSVIMNNNADKTPFSWLIWHPHQGFWNKGLMGKIRGSISSPRVHQVIINAVVHIDSFILFQSALLRRVAGAGVTSIFSKAKLPDDVSIFYFDMGTHKEGAELEMTINEILPEITGDFEAWGFEACSDSYQQASDKFRAAQNVEIIHKALFHHPPPGGTIRLYKDMQGGIGDSIYRPSEQYEDVETMRLSDFLKVKTDNSKKQIIIARMNIEGAEFDVVEDLAESGWVGKIDGYFGMWDDVSKIDIKRDKEFRAFLSRHKIKSFPFNGRDLKWPFRRKCIKYHMHTQVMKALKKLNS